MVEIFITDASNKRVADRILKFLNSHLPDYKFNFDLEDCDRILRVQSTDKMIETDVIIQLVKDHNVEISLFED